WRTFKCVLPHEHDRSAVGVDGGGLAHDLRRRVRAPPPAEILCRAWWRLSAVLCRAYGSCVYRTARVPTCHFTSAKLVFTPALLRQCGLHRNDARSAGCDGWE